MPTSFADTTATGSATAVPFLLARPHACGRDWNFRAAVTAAVAAERDDALHRNTRARIAYLLCELGFQLTRRGLNRGADLPLSRAEISTALGINLCRVKRTLALLTLSGLIATDGTTVRVLDWQRLASVAGYDPERLELSAEDMDGETPLILRGETAANTSTVAGDPACFV